MLKYQYYEISMILIQYENKDKDSHQNELKMHNYLKVIIIIKLLFSFFGKYPDMKIKKYDPHKFKLIYLLNEIKIQF